jgi:hypothetical protein
MSELIEPVLERWFGVLRGGGDVADLLAEDVVFYSPVVFTPQRGRDLAALYLRAAGVTLPGDGPAEPGDDRPAGGSFHYTKRVCQGNTAVLEFETTMNGLYVNGVDIIVANEAGLITEFRVMLRPLKAIEAVRQAMAAMLDRMVKTD